MNKYEKQHIDYLSYLSRLFDKRLSDMLQNVALRVGRSNVEFADDKILQKYIEEASSSLFERISADTINGVREEWKRANTMNDWRTNNALGIVRDGGQVPAELRAYYDHNEKALDEFIKRERNGLNLSQSVWKYRDGFEKELGAVCEVAIFDGVPANRLAKELKQYLTYPDKLFRRVRGADGELHLSKNAAMFHPGQGVYRSSYMNARRVAVTETNMAFRTADHERIQQADYVVGIKVVLSNNHNCKGVPTGQFVDICDELQGEYPKDFKFVGWHPHCRCHVETILKTDAEIDKDLEKILKGEQTTTESVNEVRDLPEGFKDWMKNNEERIATAKSQPYFLRDNKDIIENGSLAQHREVIEPIRPVVKSNLEETANMIGVEVGKPMSFEEANEMRGNPHYVQGSKNEYTVNCQSCVVANELRRRGLDVEANGNTKRKGNASRELSYKTEMAWIDPNTGQIPNKVRVQYHPRDGFGLSSEEKYQLFMSRLDDVTGDIGRYHIDWYWRGENSGHIVTLERLPDGKLRMYDPQTGKIGKFDISLFNRVESWGVNVLRVDNLEVNTDVAKGVVSKAGTTKPSKKTKDDVVWRRWNSYYNKLRKSGLSEDEIFERLERFNSKELVDKFREYRKDRLSRGLKGYFGEDDSLYNIRKSLISEDIIKTVTNYDNLYSKNLLKSKRTMKDALNHCYNVEEVNAFVYAWNNPEKLKNPKGQVLGKGKDLTNPKDIKNIEEKRKRGVVKYCVYELDYNNTKWIVKTEIMKYGYERIYHVMKK